MLAELRAVYLCIWQGLFIFMEHLNSSTYKAGFYQANKSIKPFKTHFMVCLKYFRLSYLLIICLFFLMSQSGIIFPKIGLLTSWRPVTMVC